MKASRPPRPPNPARPIGLLSTIGVLLLLAGCGAGTGSAPPSTGAPSQESPTPTPKETPTLEATPTPTPTLPDTPEPTPAANMLHVNSAGDPPIHLSAGTWTTPHGGFMPGLSLTVPAGWSYGEQDDGELNLFADDHPDDHMMLWEDIAAVTSDGSGQLVPNVPRTPDGITGYLRTNPDLVVTKPRKRNIAGGTAAVTYVVSVSDTAQFTWTDCPSYPRCADMITDPQHWDGTVYGIGAPETTRLYLATVGATEDPHLFVIALDATDPKALTRFTKVAAPVIGSIRLPAPTG